MKNFYWSLMAFILTIANCSGTFGQIITDYSSGVTETLNWKRSFFDESNYTKKLDENNRKVYVKNQSLIQNASEGEEGENDIVLLNVNLIFDEEQYTPKYISALREDGSDEFAFWENMNPVSLELPEGTYDIIAHFIDDSSQRSHIVIKELTNVSSQNSQISIDVEEATNFISTDILSEEGEPLRPGILDYNTGEITGGNASVIFDRLLYFTPSGTTPFAYSYLWGGSNEISEPMWFFYINDISERYSIIQQAIGKGYNHKYYFSKYNSIAGVSNSVSMVNEDWNFHQEKFQPSLFGQSSEEIYCGFSTMSTIGNTFNFGWESWSVDNVYDADEGLQIYLNNPFDNNIDDLMVFPKIVEYADTNSGDYYCINGNSVISADNGQILYGSGNSTLSSGSFLSSALLYNTQNGTKVLPFHPQFSFMKDENVDAPQGNNVPVLLTAAIVIPENMSFVAPLYKGRYGETRESDLFAATTVEVKQNGSVFFSGDYMGFQQTTLPTSGLLDITLTNSNIEVDGLPGKNTAQVSFDAGEENAPPTLMHLQFRNADSQVSDRFTSSQEGTVRLAAGDFYYISGNYFDYVEGNTIQFFYSLYNQDEWTELELTEHEEYFQMPAFGDYYEASLASVVVPEENSWFDVRIICTDAAGNKQEQVISPAFKVEQTTLGIYDLDKSGFSVYPNSFTNDLNIQLPNELKGNYTFRVSDIIGKTIYSENNKSESKFVWNGYSLPKGVYIISIENNGKAITKKVIKK